MQVDHHVTKTAAETLKLALDAGADFNCGCVVNNATHALIASGAIPKSRLAESARRIFRTLFDLGEFNPDADVPFRAFGAKSIDSPRARALALEAAEQGTVLLKNAGGVLAGLPIALGDGGISVGFIGPHANATVAMQGSYHGESKLVLSHSPWLALERLAAEKGFTAKYAAGLASVGDTSTAGFAAAEAVAASVDVAVVFVGLDQIQESVGQRQQPERPPVPGAAGRAGGPDQAGGRPAETKREEEPDRRGAHERGHDRGRELARQRRLLARGVLPGAARRRRGRQPALRPGRGQPIREWWGVDLGAGSCRSVAAMLDGRNLWD